MTANGPDLDEAAHQVVQEALGVAVSAAVGVGLLTPGPDPMTRVAAAVTAAKTAFVGYLATRGLWRRNTTSTSIIAPLPISAGLCLCAGMAAVAAGKVLVRFRARSLITLGNRYADRVHIA